MKKQLETRKGFTIIEVVLVLAIAGLIFMMVFLALPALQRSQRDTQRSQDVQRLIATINNYKANNRGDLPSGTGKFFNVGGAIKTARTGGNPATATAGTWGYFYQNYLLAGTDVFEDPNGLTYGLEVVNCSPQGGSSAANGTACNNNAQILKATGSASTFESRDATILIVRAAMCDGESSVYNKGTRNIAALYKREGGGVICMNS